MERYINADDLKHDLTVLFKSNKDLIDEWLAYIVDDIIDEHKKCGGVDLVRCKDCIHNEGSEDEAWCRIYECRKSKDGFCDEGKNKDGEIH